MTIENIYRTVNCGELREENIGSDVRVAGWVENIRDHGGVMFLDIRDQYGVVQVVVHDDKLLENINRECTVTLSGKVVTIDVATVAGTQKVSAVEGKITLKGEQKKVYLALPKEKCQTEYNILLSNEFCGGER